MTSLTDKMEERPAPTVLTYEQMRPGQEVEQHLRTHGHLPEDGCCDAKAEEAVVGDWEAELKSRLIGEDGWLIDHPEERCEEIMKYITNLLAAKDREIEEAMQARVNLGQALQDMYSQYCQDGHIFMSAGEQASAVLEHYGYGSFDEMGRISPLTK